MNMETGRNPRIAVIGAGGVGGYLSALLAKAFPHVTVVARNARGEAFREKGIVLHSDLNGEVIAHPEQIAPSVAFLKPQDYVFVCVKNYSLEEVLRDLPSAVHAGTVIIPVMNGVDAGARIRDAIPEAFTMDAVIYIVSYAQEDYSIRHEGAFANVRLGFPNASPAQQKKLEQVSGILDRANIQHKISEDIRLDIWRKFVLNCAYNISTTYYDCPIGPIRADKVRAKEFEDLAREAYEVGVEEGVALRPEHLQIIIDRFYHEYDDAASSSLQRDAHAGKRVELDTFTGYIVKEAKRLGLHVPVSERIYSELYERTK